MCTYVCLCEYVLYVYNVCVCVCVCLYKKSRALEDGSNENRNPASHSSNTLLPSVVVQRSHIRF